MTQPHDITNEIKRLARTRYPEIRQEPKPGNLVPGSYWLKPTQYVRESVSTNVSPCDTCNASCIARWISRSGTTCYEAAIVYTNAWGLALIVNSFAVYARKGGSGKTTVATQVACAAARHGLRVLLVDLDSTGNVAQGLGLAERTDHGEAVARAVLNGQPIKTPTVVDRNRPGLSVICGGQAADPALASLLSGNRDARHLQTALSHLASRADLVVVDTPSMAYGFRDTLIRTVSGLVVPADTDIGTVGTFLQLTSALNAQQHEPIARILGVALVRCRAGATTIQQRVRDLYTQVGAHVFSSVLRSVPRVAADLRFLGLDLWQYTEQVTAERAQTRNPTAWNYAASALSLRDEVERLTAEILQRLHSEETP